jgi:N-acetylglucosaminyldiphosphoundecaprenol N-acetyl-beta-D-mannosaminyltransferase
MAPKLLQRITKIYQPATAAEQTRPMPLLSREDSVLNTPQARPGASAEPSVRILGSRVHLISPARTVDHIESWIGTRDGRCRQAIVTGFHGLLEAHKSPRIHSILNNADLWVPDGIAPIWFARLRGHRHVDRAPGAEIMFEFLRRANASGYSSYFYGDTEETLAALCDRVKRDYPGHRIAGAYSPPFRRLSDAEQTEIVERINAARPDILWVALGMPKQDIWIHERLARLQYAGRDRCRRGLRFRRRHRLPLSSSGWAAQDSSGSTVSSRSPASSGVATCSTGPASSSMPGSIFFATGNPDLSV